MPEKRSSLGRGADSPIWRRKAASRRVSVDPDKSTERVFVCVIELWFTPIGGEGETNMGCSFTVEATSLSELAKIGAEREFTTQERRGLQASGDQVGRWRMRD